MHAILIAESTAKLMKLASFARTTTPDHHWRAISTGAFTVAVDRFDTTRQQPRMKLKHRIQLNRIIAVTAEADRVYVATDPTARGDLLAADLAEQILARYPDRQIQRLVVRELTQQAFSDAMANSGTINPQTGDAMRVSRIINFLVATRVEALTGKPSGRAVLPLVAELAGMEREGMGRVRLRLSSGVEFLSDFVPADLAASVLDRLRGEVPRLVLERAEETLEPPVLYDARRLQVDGCRILGARSIEVAAQTESLYQSGYVARDRSVGEEYGAVAREELAQYGDAPGRPFTATGAIVPVNLRCLPSDVPKPVRPVYRLIWANTLCAYGKPMQVNVETARFALDGVAFTARSAVSMSQGFDHVSFGLFYRRGRIGAVRSVEDARMFGGGPFEYELLERMRLPYDNPAHVIKAAHNLNYIGHDGPETMVLEHGRAVLNALSERVPQLLDGGLFSATERYLRSGHDPHELVAPWSRWAEAVSKAVKKREVAYLR